MVCNLTEKIKRLLLKMTSYFMVGVDSTRWGERCSYSAVKCQQKRDFARFYWEPCIFTFWFPAQPFKIRKKSQIITINASKQRVYKYQEMAPAGLLLFYGDWKNEFLLMCSDFSSCDWLRPPTHRTHLLRIQWSGLLFFNNKPPSHKGKWCMLLRSRQMGA